jgi:hypothetical protein
MGRMNNAKSQANAEATKHQASRARFSKPPPKKNGGKGGRGGGKGGGGRGDGGRGDGGRGGSEGRGDGGRGGGRDGGRGGRGGGRGPTKATASVVRKIAERVQDGNQGSKKKAGGANNPLADIDKSRLEELTLSEDSANLITQLLKDLNVMGDSTGRLSQNKDESDDAGAYYDADDDDADESWYGDDEDVGNSNHNSQNGVGDSVVMVDEAMQRDPIFCHLTMQLSFSKQDAARAVQQAPAGNATVTATGSTFDRTKLTNAFDWLCLHLTEKDLEAGFRRNKTSFYNANTGRLGDNTFNGATPLGKGATKAIPHPSISVAKKLTEDVEWRVEERVIGFLRLGFHSAEAMQACEDTDADFTKAGSKRIEAIQDHKTLRIVLSALERETLGEKAVAAQSGTPVDNKGAAAEREMEREALFAIYGDQFQVLESGGGLGRWKAKINNPTTELAKPAIAQNCELHIFHRPGYPSTQVPLFLLTNSTFPPPFLRHINAAIAREAHSILGVPVVFDIVSFVECNLLSLQRDYLNNEKRAKDLEAEQLRLRSADKHDKPAEKAHGNNAKSKVEQEKERPERVKSQDKTENSNGSSNIPQAAPTSKAFMDRVRTLTAGKYSLAEAKQQVANEDKKILEAKHRPTPVAVPVGDLAKVMQEVIDVQNEQPWLVSEEARVVGAASKRDAGPTANQLKRREEISKSLRDALEQKYGTSKGSKKSTGVSKPFQKMLAQRQRLPAYKMKDEIISTIARSQITVIAGDTGCG